MEKINSDNLDKIELDKIDLVENKCPSCGGQLHFDPESQQLKCGSCKITSGHPSLDGSMPDASVSNIPQSETDEKGLNCPNCGGELNLVTGSRTANCPYCDSSFNMLQEGEDCKLTGEIPEDHKKISPFTVSKELYQMGMISWLSDERFTPAGVFKDIAFIRSEGYYVPFYYCLANYKINWTASIGYDRIETYVVHRTQKDASGNIRVIPVTKTRVVTDWRPFSSNLSGSVTNLIEASQYLRQSAIKTQGANPLKKQSAIAKVFESIGLKGGGSFEPLENIEDYIASSLGHTGAGARAGGLSKNLNQDLSQDLNQFNPKYTAGFTVLPCEEEVIKVYDKAVIDRKITRAIELIAPGDRIRDIRYNGNIVPDYYMVYLPRWFSVYSYENEVHFNTCSGTDPASHFGTRPSCEDSRALVNKWGGLTIGFVLLFVALLTAVAASEEVILLFFAVPAAAASIFSIIKWKKAKGTAKNNQQINREQSMPYLKNPSTLFSRKSAKADPTA